MEERLQKILSRAGIASRRGAEKVMAEGRISVNGEVVRILGTKADITRDDVRVDGVRLRPRAAPIYLVLNKPKGAVATRHDPEGRTTVMDLVPRVAGLFPIGRLDVTTEGLLLLTNDGDFAERVAHPRYEVPRVYHAKVHRVPDADTMTRLRRGVWVEGERLAADRIRLIEADNNAWVEVTLHEGRTHEVKHLLDAVGHPVSKLKRVAFGPVTLKGLKPGEYRSLTPAEVQELRRGRARTRPRPVPTPRRSPATPRARVEAPRLAVTAPTRRASPRRSGATPNRRGAPRRAGSTPTRSAATGRR